MNMKNLIRNLKDRHICYKNKYLKKLERLEVVEIKYSDMYNNEINENGNKKRNDYSSLEGAINKVGVYIFYTEDDNQKIEFLYVGEGHTLNDNRDLKKRITQHFTADNTGGLPYKIAKKDKNYATNIIEDFIEKDVKIGYITLDDNVKEIIFMESFLISSLEPQYNFFKIGE